MHLFQKGGGFDIAFWMHETRMRQQLLFFSHCLIQQPFYPFFNNRIIPYSTTILALLEETIYPLPHNDFHYFKPYPTTIIQKLPFLPLLK
jgi:hypothetical protein